MMTVGNQSDPIGVAITWTCLYERWEKAQARIEELEAVLKKGYPGLYPLMLRNYDYQRQVTQCRRINEDLQARIDAAVKFMQGRISYIERKLEKHYNTVPRPPADEGLYLFEQKAKYASVYNEPLKILTGKTEKGEAK